MVWTAPFATAATITVRLVFATATFVFTVISSPADAREMTAAVTAMEASVATNARGAAGVNVTTVWNAVDLPASAGAIVAAGATNLAMTALAGTQLRNASVTVTVVVAATTAHQIADAIVMCAVMIVRSATAIAMSVMTAVTATTAAASAMIAATTAKMTTQRAMIRIITNLQLTKLSGSLSEFKRQSGCISPSKKLTK